MYGNQGLEPGSRPALREDVILELVRHFVLQHVRQVRVVPGEGQHHPVPEEFGYASRAFARRLAA